MSVYRSAVHPYARRRPMHLDQSQINDGITEDFVQVFAYHESRADVLETVGIQSNATSTLDLLQVTGTKYYT